MTLKELLEREVRKTAESVLREAYERASRILSKAELEAKDILREHTQIARGVYSQSYHSFLSDYQKRAKEKVLSAQVDILKGAREKAKKRLMKVVEDERSYREVLKDLLEETLPHVGENVVVYVNPRDVEIVKHILKELPKEWILRPPKDTHMWDVVADEKVWAGVVVMDRSRNFILNNDLAVRLDRAYQALLEEFRKEVEYVEERV